jgi:pyridoxamine 5'-phosphate oxidase
MLSELAEYNLSLSPLDSFLNWHKDASLIEDNADAMSVSTYDSLLKRPMTRTLLFKGVREGKIQFYTNYLSQKGMQLEESSEICLLFYWLRSMHQVRIQGRVSKMNRNDSVEYFHSRDRESQLASYISKQSSPIHSKKELVEKMEMARMEFENKEIPTPIHWGGYFVEPTEFEFFIYGKNRLNDRFLFNNLNAGSWTITRLQP